MATRTIIVDGNGTNALSFQLDGPDVTEVEAVLAEIDAGGAGDTIATLLATSPAGSDVAAVPQGQAITGGGQGRATWALRLAEDGGAAGADLAVTDGVTTIDPTTTLRIGAFLQLFALGGGVAFVRGVAPPTLPPVLRALFDVFSQANAQPPVSTFPIFSSRNDNGAVVVVGGQAFFTFTQTFAQRMTVQGVIQNPTGATITAQLVGHTSVSTPVVGFPFTTVVQHVPPGGEMPLPLVLRDLAPGAFSDGWLEFTAVDEGTGLPIAGVQLTGEIAFLET